MKKNYLKPATLVQTIQMGHLMEESLGVYGDGKITDGKTILSRNPNKLWDDDDDDWDF